MSKHFVGYTLCKEGVYLHFKHKTMGLYNFSKKAPKHIFCLDKLSF